MTLSSLPERIGGVEVKFNVLLISIQDEDTWSAVISAVTRKKNPSSLITLKVCLDVGPQIMLYIYIYIYLFIYLFNIILNILLLIYY